MEPSLVSACFSRKSRNFDTSYNSQRYDINIEKTDILQGHWVGGETNREVSTINVATQGRIMQERSEAAVSLYELSG
jgi:hypothetical protein